MARQAADRAAVEQTRGEQIYQLKVTLKGSSPPIWRRIQVPGGISLRDLHMVLQVAMGWTDSHLYQFAVGSGRYDQRTFYGEKDAGADYDSPMRDAARVRLSQVAPAVKSRLIYEYDFGDGWEHELLVEKVLPPEPGVSYPVCITGRRACPPEDVGGVWGYAEFLAAIRDPSHPEHQDMLEWIGGEFDPAAFDLEDVNDALKALAESRRPDQPG